MTVKLTSADAFLFGSDLGPRPRRPIPPASLDPVETTVSSVECSPSAPDVAESKPSRSDFRHSGWAAHRQRVIAALREAYGQGWALEAFKDCGDGMWILQNRQDPTKYKAVANHCKSKWCVPCYRARAFTIRNRIAERLDDKPVRFITLTLRHGQTSLAACLDRLYAGFRALRAKALWKNRVVGGVAFLEVKRGQSTGLWHPHFHILCQGRFLPQADLAKAWLDVTGDSSIVDIRLVRSRSAVLNYVTEYVTKTAQIAAFNPARPADCDLPTPHESMVEAMRALRGRRCIIGFGLWRTWRLLAAESDPDWDLVASVAELEFRATDGDGHAAAILDAMKYANDDPEGVFRVLDDTS